MKAIRIFLRSPHHSSAADNIAGPVRCLHNNYIVEREIVIILDIDDLYHTGVLTTITRYIHKGKQNYAPMATSAGIAFYRTSRLTLVFSELSENLSDYLPHSALKSLQIIFTVVVLFAQLAKILTH